MIEDIRALIFPGYFGTLAPRVESHRDWMRPSLGKLRADIEEQIQAALCFHCEGVTERRSCLEQAGTVADLLMARLPDIRKKMARDVRAAYNGDPAAKNLDEPILCHPGVLAITNYRIAHELYLHSIPLLPRIITELAHSQTGIDIHPGASIGESFFIDHGTGVVIGETCVIGDRVCLYQGVTLGAKSFQRDESGNPTKGVPRHPIVEDAVVVYAGATILGRITIGRGSIIGGNVWLTKSVPANSRITQASVRRDVFTEGAGI